MKLTDEFDVMMTAVQEDYDLIKRNKESKYLDDYEKGYIDGAGETFSSMMTLLKAIRSKIEKLEDEQDTEI